MQAIGLGLPSEDIPITKIRVDGARPKYCISGGAGAARQTSLTINKQIYNEKLYNMRKTLLAPMIGSQ